MITVILVGGPLDGTKLDESYSSHETLAFPDMDLKREVMLPPDGPNGYYVRYNSIGYHSYRRRNSSVYDYELTVGTPVRSALANYMENYLESRGETRTGTEGAPA